MSLPSFLRRHRVAVASTAVVAVAAGSLVAYALASRGYPVRHVDLNDGGIWVTNDHDNLFGRLNKPAGALDAAFNPPGDTSETGQLDVVQDGSSVAALNIATSELFPVDIAGAKIVEDSGAAVPGGAVVAMAGGTLAVLDSVSGNVWAVAEDPSAPLGDLTSIDSSAPPLASVGPSRDKSNHAAMAVGVDGTIHVVAPSGDVLRIPRSGTGFGAVEKSSLGGTLSAPQITAMGDQIVVFDAATGQLRLPGGRTVTLDKSAKLQTPSPGRSTVVVATAEALLSVPVAGGDPTTLFTVSGGTGYVAAPTWLAGCFHAAWAANRGIYARTCDGQSVRNATLTKPLAMPVFRVNRKSVVLNDTSTGAVWDILPDKPQQLDNWDSVDPKPQDTDKNKDSDAPETAKQDEPPKAQDDEFGARPGRTTVLHVLDNDSDPQGYIMAVRSVTEPDAPGVQLSISPDGQTVQISLPASASAPVRFGYTVDDGKKTDDATVVVTPTPLGTDTPPALRPKAPSYAWTVAAGGRLSIPALADWRDHEGDPIFLTGVGSDTKTAIVSSSTDGRIDVVAPPTAATVTVKYSVSDGFMPSPPATIAVTVLDPAATTSTPPIAQADVARGQVGRPIVVHPLDNDLPGADPTNPGAELALAGPVPSSPNAPVDTDLDTGTVTIIPRKSGVVTLEYSAAFGNAPYAKGKIRVDVADPPATPQRPIAMPDTGVLYGQNPAIVDVLANDFDPSGAVLVVQHAEAVDAKSPVQVAIVSGHWLRITASSGVPSSTPIVLRYTLADGVAATSTGEVTLTAQPKPPADAPVTRDDVATVRAGDSVTVPVLDNDSTPAGSTLSLQPVVSGQKDLADGQLRVTTVDGKTEGIGAAYVSGNLVRYVPPASVSAPTTALIDYVATNPDAETAIGHVRISITPAPSTANPNNPPMPKALESRVVAGDTVHINVPTSGVDPDGDSVAVTGIAVPSGTAAATLGRVTKITATTIDYQAFPSIRAGGTDTLTYEVSDRFGGVGQAVVRIAVVQPGDPQPPVAVDDTITAAPGAKVAVDVIANDLQAPDDTVTIEDLGKTNPELSAAVSLHDNAIEATSPQSTSRPLVILYGITDGLGTPSIGKLTIRSVAKYNNPPIALDAFATPSGQADTVTVDVLARDDDVDGAITKAKLTTFDAPGVTVAGGKVTVKVGRNPQTIPYQVEDEGGAVATAVLHIPAAGAGVPYVKDGTLIRVDQGKSATVDVNDYVTDPGGKKLSLTLVDRAWAAPAEGLGVKVTGGNTLALTGLGKYIGPAAVTFEVTDGTSINDPKGVTGVVTVPVQIGPETPVLRCPASPLTLTQGGDDLGLDITSLCHVWVANADDKPNLSYSLNWSKQPNDVEIIDNGSHRPSVRPNTNATAGETGAAKVTVDGTEAAPAVLNFGVTAAPPPTIAPVTVDGFKASDTATVDLKGYVSSPLKNPEIHVVSVSKTAGEPATATENGSVVTIKPGADSQGRIEFSVIATDVSGDSQTERQVTGRIVLNVLNVPDAPGAPVPGRSVISHQVQLSWAAPASNGAPIDSYTVSWSGGSQKCASTSCAIVGLENGHAYSFTVTAHNAVGDGKPSATSASATPNEKPQAVTNLTVTDPQDHQVTLTWNAAQVDGTPVTKYLVAWGGGKSTTVGGSATTAMPKALENNNKYTFTVTAFNQLGPGPEASIPGQSAGKPDPMPAPTVPSADPASQNAGTVAVVRWPDETNANGPAIASYTVYRRTGASGSGEPLANCTATPASQKSCRDSVPNDGTVYSYAVVATNGGDKSSEPSAWTTFSATGAPDPVTITSFTDHDGSGGFDRAVKISFTLGANVRGATITRVHWAANNSGGEGDFPINAGSGSFSETITGLANGTDYSVTLTAYNADAGGTEIGHSSDVTTASSANPYGPMTAPDVPSPDVAACAGSADNIRWTISGGNGNGRPASYEASEDGAGWFAVSGNTVDQGVGCDSGGHRLDVRMARNVNGVTDYSPTNSNTATAATTPPPPNPTINAWQGDQGTSSIGTCTSTNQNCHWLNFTFANFPAGTYTWECISNGTVSYTSTARVSTGNGNASYSGTAAHGYCIWGSGYNEAIRINGYTSNAVPHS